METPQDFKRGSLIKVSQKIKDGKKERVISFEGRVIKSRGVGLNKMLTVRQQIDKVDVDRIFPLGSPSIMKVDRVEEKKKRSKPRR